MVARMRALAERTGARITIEADPLKAVKAADFLYTYLWVSMGQPEDVWKQRSDQLLPYRVTTALMQATSKPPLRSRCTSSSHRGRCRARDPQQCRLRPHCRRPAWRQQREPADEVAGRLRHRANT
ncbi:MAG: hypothetical protein ABI434_20215 [Burkholderiaceae bacterium]